MDWDVIHLPELYKQTPLILFSQGVFELLQDEPIFS